MIGVALATESMPPDVARPSCARGSPTPRQPLVRRDSRSSRAVRMTSSRSRRQTTTASLRVPIYDFGETDGRFWFAMPLIEGRTLRHAIGAVPRRWPDLARFCLPIVSRIEAAHRREIIHGDTGALARRSTAPAGRGRMAVAVLFRVRRRLLRRVAANATPPRRLNRRADRSRVTVGHRVP